MKYSKIVGTGRYLPEKVLTNFDLEKMVDTNDEWIRTRTGVERRHAVADDETTSDMCVEAAKVAIEDAGIDVTDIDMVLVGHSFRCAWTRQDDRCNTVHRPSCF